LTLFTLRSGCNCLFVYRNFAQYQFFQIHFLAGIINIYADEISFIIII